MFGLRSLGWFFVLALASSCSLSGTPKKLQPTKPGSIAGDAAALKRKIERSQHSLRVDRQAHLPGPPVASAVADDWKPLDSSELEFHAIKYRINLNFPADTLVGPTALLKPQSFHGQVQMTFKPLKDAFQLLTLDSSRLDIRSVRLLNTFENLRFEVRGEQLLIDLNQAYTTADTLTVLIEYRWERSPNQGIYYRSRDGVDGIETIFSQSEAEESKYWFPGNARPNDRSTFETFVTVPEPFVALSNGALVDTTSVADGYRTYHWSLSTPIVSYLFVVTAGKFAIHEDRWRGIGVQYYGPADDMERLSYSLRKTPDMLSFLSDTIGLEYPYEKYAQSVVPQYQWGGMEHVTATTLTDRTVHGPAEDAEFSSDGLVSHEMTHQWFGDLTTCKSWDHIWLNEGFATFFETLWAEHSRGHVAYLAELDDGAAWYFDEEDKDAHPVVFPFYRVNLDDYFDSRAYPKGGYILHMLRGLMGDVTFFKGIRTYIHRRQGTVSTTPDFQRAMEEVSGRDLSWFFEQWLYKPGYPKFATSWTYDSRGSQVLLTVKQTQDTSLPGGRAGTTPYFKGPVQVEVAGVSAKVQLSGQAEETFHIASLGAPAYVKFNSENGMLSKVEMDQPFDAWRAQMKSLDVTARLEAVHAIAKLPAISTDMEVEQLTRTGILSRCAAEDAQAWVRSACLDALANLADPEANPSASQAVRDAIFGASSVLATETDAQALESAAGLLSQFPAKQSLPLLKNMIQRGTSLKGAIAAIHALGNLKDAKGDIYDLLVSLLGRDSFQNRIRAAVLEALGTLADPRALELGLEYSQPRYDQTIRQGAFELLAKLGLGDASLSETARLALEAALVDPGYPIRMAAVKALGDLKNVKAIEALTRVMNSDPEGNVRTAAKEAIEAIQGKRPL